MPDSRTHRSSAPEDAALFGPSVLPTLREATWHLGWLWGHGYAERASVALVGDRFRLVSRQRDAIRRCACSDAQREARAAKLLSLPELRGRELAIDGFNVLITVESALGGGVVLGARDGCFRDLANLRGTWRRVMETLTAIEIVGEVLALLGPTQVVWYLDRGVSNSGRLRGFLERVAAERRYAWVAHLSDRVDRELRATRAVVASADSGVIDACGAWVNLARHVVCERVPSAWMVDLSSRTLPAGRD